MPVLDVSSPDITCGKNAEPISDNGVSRVGPVTAGSKIGFYWGKGFPHAGPVLTYMARCEPDCGSFDGRNIKAWFKIQNAGVTEGSWLTEVLPSKGMLHATVPACLKPGEYLVRHEIMSMSDCYKEGKCQIYLSCAQVRVEGNGEVVPSDLVAFPGVYKSNSTGILWDSSKEDMNKYVPPGPALFTCPS